ncbi:hypothetical protein QJS10_CPB20g01303 [Acorus calamus]|uniref:NADH dehydrogenase [ubiquinone] 1 alpha subcomplex assembly factor 3 n=1 Tax=Acorus calamus TaxID=4465 RepID=A0AAV9CAV4_ACOCL|nr:hypothetical protein QJS10_CPB20g01303 [Acorus calamus]
MATAMLPHLVRNLRRDLSLHSIQTSLPSGPLPPLNLHDSLKPLSLRLITSLFPSLNRRAFSLYDQINLIDNVPEDQLRFQGYSDDGFTVNGVKYEGGVLCAGNLILSWSPKRFSDITTDSLSVFKFVRPVPEILILGCGRHIQPVDPELRKFIRSSGMKLEVLDSEASSDL